MTAARRGDASRPIDPISPLLPPLPLLAVPPGGGLSPSGTGGREVEEDEEGEEEEY